MKVAHIVPSMNLGGVEVAIYRTVAMLNRAFDYKVYYVKARGTLDVEQQGISAFFLSLFKHSARPDIVVTSLWWSHVLGWIATFFGVRWIVFLHSSGFASFPDFLVTKLACSVGRTFFFDSRKTHDAMLSNNNSNKFLIPFFTLDKSATNFFCATTEFDLIWAGRNSPEKRLDLLADIATQLIDLRPQSRFRFHIAGSRSVECDDLVANYPVNVDLYYNSHPDKVLEGFQKSKITLCLSDYEGFSMSTAEAAYLGNVIASRKVGDLSLYLPIDETIWLDNVGEKSIEIFVETICELLENPNLLTEKRKKTMHFFGQKFEEHSYVSAFTEAITKSQRQD